MMLANKLRVVLLFLPLLFWCCAAAPPREQVVATVQARATAYWQHRVKGQFSKAYEFESPQLREGASLDVYYKTVAVGPVILAANVASVSLDGDTAIVAMELAVRPGTSYTPKKGLKQKITDYWSLMDGVWYHRMRDPRKK